VRLGVGEPARVGGQVQRRLQGTRLRRSGGGHEADRGAQFGFDQGPRFQTALPRQRGDQGARQHGRQRTGLHGGQQGGDGIGFECRPHQQAQAGEHLVEDRAVVHLGAEHAHRQRGGVGPAQRRAKLQARQARHGYVGAAQQMVVLDVLRPGLQPARRRDAEAAGVTQPEIDGQGVEARLEILRRHRLQHRLQARVALQEQRAEARRDRQRGGHRADDQPAGGVLRAAGQLLHQHLLLAQDAVGRRQQQLALRRQAFVLAAAAHDGDAEMLFQRPQRVRQRGLRDVAGGGGTAEVAMLLQCRQVAVTVDQVHRMSCAANGRAGEGLGLRCPSTR